MSLLIRWKIIKYIKTGNKQRSIYWNPIKREGNKMNKREREREREISKPFLLLFALVQLRERGWCVPNFCFLVSLLSFLSLLLFTLDYLVSLSSSLLYSLSLSSSQGIFTRSNPIFHRFEPFRSARSAE